MPAKVKATAAPECEPRSKKVCLALQDATHLPTPVRNMLADALPHAVISSLGGPDQRNSYQTQILTFVEEALGEMRKAASSKLTECEEGTSEVRKGLTERESARDVLLQAEEEAKASQKDADKKLQEAQAAVESATKENSEAQALKEAAVENAKEAEKAKAEALALRDTTLKELEQDDLDTKSRTKQIDSIIAYLEKLKAEKVLIAAASGALAKGAGVCGEFDRITVSAIHEIIDAQAEKQDQELKKNLSDQEESESMALGTSAVLDNAKEQLTEASELASSTLQQVTAASKSLKASQAKVAKEEESVKKYVLQEDEAKARIAEIDAIISVFDQLVKCEPAEEDKVSVPEVTTSTKIAAHEPELSTAPTLVGGA
eukprot:gnl/TRDRNA2_/TRDRNA2_37124_c0_seq1.p1 gnl/TRDRNA2_/TRDRNA2_37124_c0~~gnl/TRDRNA2_/TRDRNA2_37124_c0_seq1.p1  ORF type:complete len:381 (-),score=132.88 gnl/TRDRNA2_/TRDRNA2_37124_c0_seq1:121-1242(-)